MTIAREEVVGKNLGSNLAQVPYIYYSINFGKKSVSTLLDLGSKVNAIYLIFAKELGLLIRTADVGVQKIVDTTLNTYGMVVVAFLVKDKANQVRFFEKIFLVANVSPEVVLRMFFFILSRVNVDFLGWKLW